LPAVSRPRRSLASPAGALASACAVALATFAGALSGCGSSSTSATDADPASVVPATATVYAGATVRPTGAEKSAALAAGTALTHQSDPYARLLGVLQTPGSPKLDFSHDVEPWLGEHAGVFLSSLSTSSSLLSSLAQSLLRGSAPATYPFSTAGAQGAIVMDTSDAKEAQSFLSAQAAHAGAHAVRYRGVSFETTAAGLAFGVVEHFAVIGSVSGLHNVVDTTLGASSLAHAGGYTKLLSQAPAAAIAHVYVNPASAGEAHAAQSSAPEAQTGLAGPLGLLAGEHQSNISIVPSASSLSVDADSLATGPGDGEGLLSANPQGARALEELPGESWLAVGLPDVGANLAEDVHGLDSVTSLAGILGGSGGEGVTTGQFGIKPLLDALTTPLKVLGADTAQARRDFASWMGSGGIFATGSNLFELKAAVTIESNDPESSRAAVNLLAAELRKRGWVTSPASIPGTDAAVAARVSGLPVVVNIANGRDAAGHTKFVLGLAEASVETALAPPSTMSGAAARQAAAAALGEGIQPSVIVDLPTLLSLIEGLGLTEAPEIAPALPYLRASTTLAGGGRALNSEVERFRLVLGLQQPTTG
jgi:Protein of unknown function (DUF3352)